MATLQEIGRRIGSAEDLHSVVRQAVRAAVERYSLKELEAYCGFERRLELATTRAPISGVLTWVHQEAGATVGVGEVLARIADLDSFRVEASVADAYAARVEAGQPVRVKRRVRAGEELEAWDLSPEHDDLARLARNARTSMPLSHANIAQVLDVDTHEGMHYVAREYINGRPLVEAKTCNGRGSGGLPKGAYITKEFLDDFQSGEITIAVMTFLRFNSSRRSNTALPAVGVWDCCIGKCTKQQC